MYHLFLFLTLHKLWVSTTHSRSSFIFFDGLLSCFYVIGNDVSTHYLLFSFIRKNKNILYILFLNKKCTNCRENPDLKKKLLAYTFGSHSSVFVYTAILVNRQTTYFTKRNEIVKQKVVLRIYFILMRIRPYPLSAL